MAKNNCIENTNNKIVVCEENGKRVVFNNPNRKQIVKTKIDGCKVDNEKICDYLVTYLSVENFIELKGSKVEEAFEQLKNCILKFGDEQSYETRNSYVISSRSPLTTAEIQNYKVKFKSKFNSSLIVKNKYYEITV